MNEIIIGIQDGGFKQFEKEIKSAVFKILKILNKPSRQTKLWCEGKNNIAVEIFLVGNKEMRFLNKTLRKKDKPTNILSFSEPKNFPHPELKNKKTRYLGAIYLNISYIKKEAKDTLVDTNFLMVELLIHGMLHLFGFVHKRKNDRIKMEKKERLLIMQIHKLI